MGGPTGLCASLLLSRHGVPLMERRPGTSDQPKERGLKVRPLALFRVWALTRRCVQRQMSRIERRTSVGAEWRCEWLGNTRLVSSQDRRAPVQTRRTLLTTRRRRCCMNSIVRRACRTHRNCSRAFLSSPSHGDRARACNVDTSREYLARSWRMRPQRRGARERADRSAAQRNKKLSRKRAARIVMRRLSGDIDLPRVGVS
ncbi:MAG: FAD-dependent monooxygenase [Chloroflexi bacterium]|nr:FAD-dependent monooxygenase [Chloroflexota bacterium]